MSFFRHALGGKAIDRFGYFCDIQRKHDAVAKGDKPIEPSVEIAKQSEP